MKQLQADNSSMTLRLIFLEGILDRIEKELAKQKMKVSEKGVFGGEQ